MTPYEFLAELEKARRPHERSLIVVAKRLAVAAALQVAHGKTAVAAGVVGESPRAFTQYRIRVRLEPEETGQAVQP